MIHSTSSRLTGRLRWFAPVGAAALCLGLSACGPSIVRSGAGVGNVGQALAVHADNAGRTTEVCLLQDSLAPQSGGVDKPMTDTCRKAQKNDLLWRRSIQVMSLYGERLAGAAAGEDAETSGRIEAAMTGITAPDWTDAEDQTTRDAVSQLVGQMSAQSQSGSKIDLNKLVLEAAPPIKLLCSNLNSHFESELRDLAALRRDVDKKSTNRTIRRCGTFETHSICVADTVVDRMVYAETFARVVALENATYDAKDSVARFCAAHDKLAEAAQAGQVTKKETHAAVVEAIKAVPRTQVDWDASDTKSGDAKSTPATGAKSANPAKK